MKLIILSLLIPILAFCQTVKIDTVYAYTSEGLMCNAYVVSKHGISQNCYFTDTIIDINDENITVRLCYSIGQEAVYCVNQDTVCLGLLSPGHYNIKVVVSAGFTSSCANPYRSDSIYTALSIFPTAIEDVSLNYFSINPNPTTYQLNCEVINPKGQYSVFSITGSQLIQPTAIPATNFNVDVSTLPSGIYYMAIQDDKQRYVKKFVKQ